MHPGGRWYPKFNHPGRASPNSSQYFVVNCKNLAGPGCTLIARVWRWNENKNGLNICIFAIINSYTSNYLCNNSYLPKLHRCITVWNRACPNIIQPTTLWRYILLSSGRINARPSSLSFVIEYRRTRTNITVELKSRVRPRIKHANVWVILFL